MNILREVRRFNHKSMPLRIISILIFAVILIVTTYAWFSTQKDVKFLGLKGETTGWEVSYYINHETNEIVNHIASFTIEELYPGMDPSEDVVHIYNMGEASSNIEYELVSVKIFGEEVLDQLDIGIQGNTTTIFSGDTNYPFEISYTYDKDYITGIYDPDNEITSQTARAKVTLNADWKYEIDDNLATGATDESLDKDLLDTQFGKGAYAYYKNEENDPTKAIEIKVKITSHMIHPSLETP